MNNVLGKRVEFNELLCLLSIWVTIISKRIADHPV